MLNHVGQNWDPLGTCGLYFLEACLMLQQLAMEKFDYDQEQGPPRAERGPGAAQI